MDPREVARRELPFVRRACVFLFAPVALAVALATAVLMAAGKRVYMLFRDPATIAHFSPLVGFFSNLGALTWCAAATAALLAAAAATKREPRAGTRWFFLASATLTLVLLADDFFVLHEYAEALLGVPQYVFYGGYLLALLLYLLSFRATILSTHFSVLLLAAGFLGLSAATDVLSERLDPADTIVWRIAVEDGFKLLGIVGWCAYHVRTAFDYLVEPRTA